MWQPADAGLNNQMATFREPVRALIKQNGDEVVPTALIGQSVPRLICKLRLQALHLLVADIGGVGDNRIKRAKLFAQG